MAVAGLGRSLALFERLGATREIALVQQLLKQLTSISGEEPQDGTPARQAGGLVVATTAVLRGQTPRDQVRAGLVYLLAREGADAPGASLREFVAALIGVIDGMEGAASTLLAAAAPLLAGATAMEQVDIY